MSENKENYSDLEEVVCIDYIEDIYEFTKTEFNQYKKTLFSRNMQLKTLMIHY